MTISRWMGWAAALVLCAGCGVSPRDEMTPTGIGGTDGGDDDPLDPLDPIDPTDGLDPTTGGGSGSETGEPGDASEGGETGPGPDPDSDGGDDDDDSEGDDDDGNEPLGGQCSSSGQCASGSCWTGPMLGVCSECETDIDCQDGGAGTCAFDFDLMYAVCTDGGLGAMCESDDACAPGLVCAQAIDTGGLIAGNFCSACADDSACEAGQLCSPVYLRGEIGGWLDCVDEGSVPNGQGCPVEGQVGDDAACASGHCGVANAGGLGIYVGVCGECTTAADCGGGQCSGPSAGLMGVTGAQCQ